MCSTIFKLLTCNFSQFAPVCCHTYLTRFSSLIFLSASSNAAFAKIVHHDSYECVRLVLLTGLASNTFRSAQELIMAIFRLSTTLVTRLVLNLRERADKEIPTTVETVGRFQAALPVARQPLSMTSIRIPSLVRQNRSTPTATREMIASVAVGETRSQQFRSRDAIEYETEQRPQATLSVGRQQPATSASVRSLFSAIQNRSTGETVSVGTTGGSRRSADAIGYETERKFQAVRLDSRQPMTPTSIQSPSSVRHNRLTSETASIGTAEAFHTQIQSTDDAIRYVPLRAVPKRLTNRTLLGKRHRNPCCLDDQAAAPL